MTKLPQATIDWLDSLIAEQQNATNKDVVRMAFQLLNADQTSKAISGALSEFFGRFHLGNLIKPDTFNFKIQGSTYPAPDQITKDWYLKAEHGDEGQLIATYLINKIK